MKNITLAIDENLLNRTRIYAAQQGISVNQLVRDLLAQAIGEETPRQHAARMKLVELARNSTWDPGPDWKWSREEIYADRVSRHERHRLRGFAESDGEGETGEGGGDHG